MCAPYLGIGHHFESVMDVAASRHPAPTQDEVHIWSASVQTQPGAFLNLGADELPSVRNLGLCFHCR